MLVSTARSQKKELVEDILDTLDRFKVPDGEDALQSTATATTTSPPTVNGGGVFPSRMVASYHADLASPATESPPPPSPVHSSYAEEWERLFGGGGASDILVRLFDEAVQGQLRSSHFRSVAWRLFLNVLPPDPAKWAEETRAWRAEYARLIQQYVVDPRHVSAEDPQQDNPLSLDESSRWNQYFRASEIRREIMQDVVRTFPELEFFHDDLVRESMTNILFCFCQQSTSIMGYKQGMHEVLAPLMFILRCDQVSFRHACELGSVGDEEGARRELLETLFDEAELEADSFAMFSRIMEVVGGWYVVRETSLARADGGPVKSWQEPFTPQSKEYARLSRCSAVQRLNLIQESLLKQHDLELAIHLEKLEIAPQMYGLRWIRLLFGREYPIQDLLVLWDAIFAARNGFGLVDYVFVAMLMQIRDLLLTRDFAGCLCLMMRYPQCVDVHFIVRTALHLYRPSEFAQPTTSEHTALAKGDRSARRKHQQQRMPRNKTIGFESIINLRLPKLGGLNLNRRPSNIGGKSAALSVPPTNKAKEMYSAPALQDSLLTTPDELLFLRRPAGPEENHLRDFVEIRMPHERQAEAATIRNYEEVCRHCTTVLEACVHRMQNYLLPSDSPTSSSDKDDLVMSLAGLKQVLYILNGTLGLETSGAGTTATASTPGTATESASCSTSICEGGGGENELSSGSIRELKEIQESWRRSSNGPQPPQD